MEIKHTQEIVKSSIVVFDFEVFKNETLLGVIVKKDNQLYYFQTWETDIIKEFYQLNRNSIWVGHNNEHYDNLILQAIINNKNPYEVSKEIIGQTYAPYLNIQLNYIDLMTIYKRGSGKNIDKDGTLYYSLKMTEGALGKKISETEVSFETDGLGFDEMMETEQYNRNDLDQTYANMLALQDKISLRLDLIKEFNLSLKCLNDTETQLAEKCLNARKVVGIEKQRIEPKLYDNLLLKNEKVKEFYLNEQFKEDRHFTINLCSCEIKGGSGGIHACLNNCYCDKALYFDVSGYYNLTMLNYDLLPRTLDEKNKKLYEFMYYEQLKLKKKNPQKRKVYKTILLAVFGSMNNAHTKFYDPYKCDLVMITGQLFLIDLLEKLDGKVQLIQANTDGIIVKPLINSMEIIKIVEEWETRTKYTIKKDIITNIWQRDVNCYIYKQNGELHCIGEAVKLYNAWNNIFDCGSWQSKEPPILAHCIVDYLMYGILPEQTIENYKEQLRMFQFLAKKGSFDSLQYELTKPNGEIEITQLQHINRCFPNKDNQNIGTIFKIKDNKHNRVPNLPDNVFVYDEDINTPNQELLSKIDYQYYVDRAYEKIKTFSNKKLLKYIKV